MAKQKSTPVELADVLEHIAEGLIDANRRAAERGRATMEFEECEVELALSYTSGGEAGLKIWVLNAGGEMKRTESNTLRLKFKAIPGKGGLQAGQTLPGPGPELQTQSTPKPENEK
jgi:hypothetical protein